MNVRDIDIKKLFNEMPSEVLRSLLVQIVELDEALSENVLSIRPVKRLSEIKQVHRVGEFRYSLIVVALANEVRRKKLQENT